MFLNFINSLIFRLKSHKKCSDDKKLVILMINSFQKQGREIEYVDSKTLRLKGFINPDFFNPIIEYSIHNKKIYVNYTKYYHQLTNFYNKRNIGIEETPENIHFLVINRVADQLLKFMTENSFTKVYYKNKFLKGDENHDSLLVNTTEGLNLDLVFPCFLIFDGRFNFEHRVCFYSEENSIEYNIVLDVDIERKSVDIKCLCYGDKEIVKDHFIVKDGNIELVLNKIDFLIKKNGLTDEGLKILGLENRNQFKEEHTNVLRLLGY